MEKSEFYCCTYVSSAVTPFSETELSDLLIQSRDSNAKYNITGMLLYAEGHFIQVLEGRKLDVITLMDNIQRDARHHNVCIIKLSELANRQFPDWTMGYQTIDLNEISELVHGFSPFMMQNPLTGVPWIAPNDCQRLLDAFRLNYLFLR